MRILGLRVRVIELLTRIVIPLLLINLLILFMIFSISTKEIIPTELYIIYYSLMLFLNIMVTLFQLDFLKSSRMKRYEFLVESRLSKGRIKVDSIDTEDYKVKEDGILFKCTVDGKDYQMHVKFIDMIRDEIIVFKQRKFLEVHLRNPDENI